MNLSFAGCGFLGIYHVGVAVCFKKYAPHLLLNKISGASAGAIAACCLLCDLPIGDITTDVLNLIQEARARTLGPFSPSFNVQAVLLDGLKKVLPEDAHLRVNGKLHISLTRVCDGKNVLVSHFTSKDDLLQALLASAFVPIFSGLIPPLFHGYRYIDGGFSDNLPTLDENTITVSPFCGESDICPRDYSSQLFHVNVANTSIELSRQNIHRFARILWPPKPEVLSNMCKQGFDDALRFLHRNNLINCTRCLAVQSTFVVSEVVDETFEYDPQCQECKQHRQEALVANLPDTVMSVFQDAIDSANKGLVNWIFKHRGMKLLSVLTLPYTLPVDFVYAVFRKFLVSAPHLLDNLVEMCKFLVSEINNLLSRWNIKKHQLSANVSCQIALTNYSSDKENLNTAETKPVHLKNKMNFNFKLNLDDSDLDKSGQVSADKILSRRSSYVLHHQQQLNQQSKVEEEIEEDHSLADDTFENILNVTAKHDALMAFYYMDGSNKLKVTEIFDITEDEVKKMLNECDNNHPSNRDWVEKHKDWMNEHGWELTSSSDKGLDGYEAEDDRSLSDHSDCLENTAIFSDAESDWASQMNTTVCCHDVEDEINLSSVPIDCRPESDQSQTSSQTLI